MTRDDYLDVLRERYGPDAGRDADEPGCTLRSAQCCYCTGRAGCRAVDEDDLDADDYDPDYDLDLCGPGDPGDWYAGRPVETVWLPGVSGGQVRPDPEARNAVPDGDRTPFRNAGSNAME